MSGEAGDERTIPSDALDDEGRLLAPTEIPLSTLFDPEELLRFARSIADLTQMEASVLLYDPKAPVPVSPGAGILLVRSPVCRVVSEVCHAGECRCETDVHAAAHRAMDADACVNADCFGGENTLYACPVMLSHGARRYPKAAIVAAAQDTYNFHFADRFAKLTGRTVPEMENLLCETDKRALNADQLRRIRAIMAGQARAFSRQISVRYAELVSLSVVLSQREKLAQAYSRLDDEFRIVGEIQRRLVPDTVPQIPGYEIAVHYTPARRAGGRYCQILYFENLIQAASSFTPSTNRTPSMTSRMISDPFNTRQRLAAL